MKINNLTLINYRKFKHQSFVFNDHFTTLIGDNATGKTQVLEAIVTLFSEYQFKMMYTKLARAKSSDMDVHVEIMTSDVHHESQVFDNKNGSHQVRMEYNYPSIISATVNDKEYVFCRRDDASDEENARSSVFKRLAQDNLNKIQKQEPIILPVLAYYGTCRHWNKRNTTKEGIPSRTDGYRWSLDSYIDFNELKEWFKKQEMIQLQKGTNEIILDVMRKAITQMIPGCESVFYDLELEDLVLRFRDDATMPFDNSIVLFNELSDGYQMVLTMVFDIVKQMVTLNPHLGKTVLDETDGIIMIDELDLSLHPRWQRIVVDCLKQTFPHVQFIVTTHSPFIIQSLSPEEVIDLSECNGNILKKHMTSLKTNVIAKDSELYLLDKRKILDLPDGIAWPYAQQSNQIGRSIEDISEYVMGVKNPQWSGKLNKMYEVARQYYDLLDKMDSASETQKQSLLQQLRELIAPFKDDVAYCAYLDFKRQIKMINMEDKNNETNR